MKPKAETKALAPPAAEGSHQAGEFTHEQVALIKRTICRAASDDELSLFLQICKRTQLDPFSHQIFAVRRWDSREKRELMQVQIGIDGLRTLAERSGKYAGQTEPQWCGEDGQWVSVWLAEEPPAAARVGVLRSDFREPCYAVARYGAYVQMKKEGGPNAMWARMPDVMLSKCAEGLALRKSFPVQLSGLYTDVELAQGESGAERQTPQGAPPESQDQPEVSARPWSNFNGMISEFVKLHERLGPDYDHIYRETLREFGVAHSNEFRDYPTAQAAYRKLRAKVLKIEEAKQTAEESEIAEGFERPQDPEATI